MKKYCLQHLPHWVLTDTLPAFYDCESATAIQQTAKLYGKIQELITIYNDFVRDVNRYITEFEDGIIKDFNCFQNCVIKTMNDYIQSIDTKIELQDNNIQEAIDYMKNNLVSTITTLFNQAIASGDITANLLETYDSNDESLVLSIVASEGSGD